MGNANSEPLASLPEYEVGASIFSFPFIYLLGWEKGKGKREVACVDIRQQLAGLGSLLPPSGFWRLNSGDQAWQQVPVNLPAPSVVFPHILL